jgi:hypothetical protein
MSPITRASCQAGTNRATLPDSGRAWMPAGTRPSPDRPVSRSQSQTASTASSSTAATRNQNEANSSNSYSISCSQSSTCGKILMPSAPTRPNSPGNLPLAAAS